MSAFCGILVIGAAVYALLQLDQSREMMKVMSDKAVLMVDEIGETISESERDSAKSSSDTDNSTKGDL